MHKTIWCLAGSLCHSKKKKYFFMESINKCIDVESDTYNKWQRLFSKIGFKKTLKMLWQNAAALWNIEVYECESGWHHKHLFPIDFEL